MSYSFSVEYGPQNNYALSFDGTDGYVDCGNDSSLNIDGPFTIEFWIFPKRYEENWIISKEFIPGYSMGIQFQDL